VASELVLQRCGFDFAEINWIEKKMSVLKLHQTKKIRVQWIGESRIPHSEFLCQLQLVLIYQWSDKA
jgi:hypothetical protein